MGHDDSTRPLIEVIAPTIRAGRSRTRVGSCQNHRHATGVPASVDGGIGYKVLVMDEVPHLLLEREGAVAVVDFEAEALGGEFVLDGLQGRNQIDMHERGGERVDIFPKGEDLSWIFPPIIAQRPPK